MHIDIPKDLNANLAYRQVFTERCLKDERLRWAVIEECRCNLLFWANTFAWTFDPRKTASKQSPILPFITYPIQDDCMLQMEEWLGKEDICLVKSRAMGASWMVMALLFGHRFLFSKKQLAFGVVSREERLVDGHPKSLFAKLQFLMDKLPSWMVPRYDHFWMRFLNNETGTTIEGTSTTSQTFRGDRYTAVLMDEFAAFELPEGEKVLASSQATTNCRIMSSTPQGRTGAFARMAHNPSIRRIDLHWSKHPEYAKELWIDPQGRKRSPWYDRECARMPIPAMIAQELDLDFAGSASPFFHPPIIDRCILEHVRQPVMRGKIEEQDGKPVFVEQLKGDFLLWMFLKEPEKHVPESERYVIGCDISAGTGATNSVLSVADRRTREKVGEFASPRSGPTEFAALAVLAAKFFNDAFMIWEQNGPGVAFGKRVIDLGYRNIYYRQDEQGLERKISASMVPGFHSSPANKQLVLREYAAALSNDTFVNRSSAALDECRDYVYLATGEVDNARKATVSDPSGARSNHGDRVIADALANKALGQPVEVMRQLDENEALTPVGPYSPLARRKQWQDMERGRSGWESSPEARAGWEETEESLKGW